MTGIWRVKLNGEYVRPILHGQKLADVELEFRRHQIDIEGLDVENLVSAYIGRAKRGDKIEIECLLEE